MLPASSRSRRRDSENIMEPPLYKVGSLVRFKYFDNHSTTGVITACGTGFEKYTVRCGAGRFYRIREYEVMHEIRPRIHGYVRELTTL